MKNLHSSCFVTSLWLLSFYLWMSILKATDENSNVGAVSGSVSQRYRSADPDPYQNGTDPQHKYIRSVGLRYGIYFLEPFLPVMALLIDKRLTAHRLCFNFSVNFSRFKLPSVHRALLPVPPFNCPWTWKVFLQGRSLCSMPHLETDRVCVTLTLHSLGVVQQRVCGVERVVFRRRR